MKKFYKGQRIVLKKKAMEMQTDYPMVAQFVKLQLTEEFEAGTVFTVDQNTEDEWVHVSWFRPSGDFKRAGYCTQQFKSLVEKEKKTVDAEPKEQSVDQLREENESIILQVRRMAKRIEKKQKYWEQNAKIIEDHDKAIEAAVVKVYIKANAPTGDAGYWNRHMDPMRGTVVSALPKSNVDRIFVPNTNKEIPHQKQWSVRRADCVIVEGVF